MRGLGGVAEAVGGVEDHVHILASLNTTTAIADFMRELKKSSSVWVSDQHDQRFAWQEGYAVFSVSNTHRPQVAKYITDQEEHHRQIPFKEELIRLLEKNGVKWDPRYLD